MFNVHWPQVTQVLVFCFLLVTDVFPPMLICCSFFGVLISLFQNRCLQLHRQGWCLELMIINGHYWSLSFVYLLCYSQSVEMFCFCWLFFCCFEPALGRGLGHPVQALGFNCLLPLQLSLHGNCYATDCTMRQFLKQKWIPAMENLTAIFRNTSAKTLEKTWERWCVITWDPGNWAEGGEQADSKQLPLLPAPVTTASAPSLEFNVQCVFQAQDVNKQVPQHHRVHVCFGHHRPIMRNWNPRSNLKIVLPASSHLMLLSFDYSWLFQCYA